MIKSIINGFLFMIMVPFLTGLLIIEKEFTLVGYILCLISIWITWSYVNWRLKEDKKQ